MSSSASSRRRTARDSASTTSPERVRAETIEALRASVATLQAEGPDGGRPYRQLVLGVAEAVAGAKGGEAPVEGRSSSRSARAWTPAESSPSSRRRSSMAGIGRHVSTRQAAFIGVGAMVGAGIFSLLGAAGEVAGAAVWLSFLLAGDRSRRSRGTRSPSSAPRIPVGRRAARVRRPGFGLGHVATVTAWLSTPRTRSSPRWSRSRSGAMRARCSRTGTPRGRRRSRSLVVVAMTGAERVGIHDRRAGPEPHRVRGRRDPRGFAVGDAREHGPVAARAVGVSGRRRHRLERGSDLLRVPRVRGRDVHREGPRGSVPPAPEGDVDRPRSIATVVYVAVALGVFGTLTVAEVIASGSDGDRGRRPTGARRRRVLC